MIYGLAGEQTARQSPEQWRCHNCPALNADGLFRAGHIIYDLQTADVGPQGIEIEAFRRNARVI